MRNAGGAGLRNRPLIFSASIFLSSAILAVALYLNPLIQKENFLKNDRSVALALDWGDTVLRPAPTDFLERAHALGVRALVLDVEEKIEIVHRVRNLGFAILWRSDRLTPEIFSTFKARLVPGDGVLPTDYGTFGYPGYLELVRSEVVDNNGFITRVEFDSNKGLPVLAKDPQVRVLKTHVLHLEESITPAAALWRARFVRAVRERAIRLLLIRLSPAWMPDQQLDFLEKVAGDLNQAGFQMEISSGQLPPWRGKANGFKKFLALGLAVGGPLAGLILAMGIFGQRPWCGFFVIIGASVISGLAAHALAFDPRVLSGLAEFRGVKMALIAPIFLSLFVVFSPSDWRSVWNEPLRVKHALFIGGIGLFFIGGLLIRSGNFPIVGVSNFERMARDFVENIFVVRPRFKEVFIGVPFLLYGLHRRAIFNDLKSQIFIVLGMVGPASMINTFCHLHIPLSFGLLRTFHGVWLGSLVYFLFLQMKRFCRRSL